MKKLVYSCYCFLVLALPLTIGGSVGVLFGGGCGSGAGSGNGTSEDEDANAANADGESNDEEGNNGSGDNNNDSASSITLIDNNGAAISEGATGIDPTSIALTFPEAMAYDTVSTAGNITLTCDSDSGIQLNPNIIQAATDTDNGVLNDEFTLTFNDSYAYQLANCTLTIGNAVTTADGTPFAETSVTFQNGCAASDDFTDAQTIGDSSLSRCWGVASGGGLTITAWDGISDFFSIDSANSNAVAEIPDGESFGFFKPVNIGDIYTVEVEFAPESRLTQGADEGEQASSVSFSLDDTSPEVDSSIQLLLYGTPDGNQVCSVTAIDGVENSRSEYVTLCNEDNMGYSIRLTKSGNTFTAEYKSWLTDWADLPFVTGPALESTNIANIAGDGLSMTLGFNSHSGAPDEVVSVGYVIVDGITVDGQY